ncbi:XRE family transcriptional regulator [Pseudomonas jilinensis]|uniref:C repressor n=1 Tax=Pseudomonas jilinensis TaxID=2078689 RepID=A0A396RZ42_9PSED|nr:helix-turn-helix transcriptional regulator [Pseudomonas jilinensis]RHW21917.1 c repressor [Pseudomonas jilinensis]
MQSESQHGLGTTVPFSPEAIGTRIEEIAERVGGKRELANLAGIHETQLYKYIKGANSPSIAVAVALADTAKVSLDWLLLGKGESVPEANADAEYSYIPLYDAKISAGHGSWAEGAKVLTRLAFTRYSLRKKGLDPAKLSAVRVDGDSMLGLLDDGDTVMVDHSRNTLEGEGVYVIRLDDHMYAKRLQRQFDGSVHVISENKAYRDMVIPKSYQEEFEIIGRVVWAGGWMV